ncbi:hypothetical protein SSS_02902 [Sarcoptes scabiei]|uniref:High mobility group protein-like protein n=1 Tax=Sarcoptes scabiei TaxID=52283 RepID=A0A131ZX78_SARSC|nr:hypothetical protein SSS_02902 [Sarcoptes scabiei]KPM03281.1 high mobility group protein-like protein [Sarcoptes scabiei]
MNKLLEFNLLWRYSSLSLLNVSNGHNLTKYNCFQSRYLAIDQSKSNLDSNQIVLPEPPKRSSNVFALFIKDCFKRLPADMPVKEKFSIAGKEWRQMSDEDKEPYLKLGSEEFIKYKTAMNEYLKSLSASEMDQYKKNKKNAVKNRNRQRIKSKLRELKYPKRNLSSYIFFVRSKLKEKYPDGHYPAVKSTEHIEFAKKCAENWRKMTAEEREPFEKQSEEDKKRYFEELEQWKLDLAKPENEDKFRQLERLSRKMEVANLTAEKAKLHAERQRKVAAKIIKKHMLKKSKASKKLAKTKAKTKSVKSKKD